MGWSPEKSLAKAVRFSPTGRLQGPRVGTTLLGMPSRCVAGWELGGAQTGQVEWPSGLCLVTSAYPEELLNSQHRRVF